ncbi:aspartate carbamoyltransferase catalytic subunit [Legionella nagasakiensis]|uniref:aspartate carbamoyltransferase catalytic subunit n=1 Tax=Legionella nagasakiensis TaxID=535290 RepID=UPI001054AC69|nr:aspartate carbamoyltransferase catalytic subunit [Legionella nagasakiensis]
MRHFLQISQLSRQEADRLIERALILKNHANFPAYSQFTVANLFYENSTRTRVSFELAAKKLRMSVINLDLQSSSEKKGETIGDTIKTLTAMGISFLVIRHSEDGLPQLLAAQCNDVVQIINAGDGKHAHPSQALLDMMTIMETKPHLSQLKIAVVGDIRHSRVANSMQALCALMGVGELIFVAPDIWQPESVAFGQITSSLRDGIKEADVVMCLRVQRERLLASEHLDVETYRRDYALTKEVLAYAKPDAVVMHPGPMNRGIEIDNDVADGLQSVILRQVHNGVFMRMAIFDLLCKAA